jgi:glutamyl-tRNA synthetase
MDKNKKIVTRVAPSPTGPYGAHIGNLRTALFNYLFAKQNGGTFYLRIEDTDQDRFCEGAEDLIRKSFEWLGIIPDFAPWTQNQPHGAMRQSERDYTKYIRFLLENGHAYYAFDTKDELDALRAKDQNFSYGHANRMNLKNSLALSTDEVERLLDAKTPYTVRFKVPSNQDITFTDLVRGVVTFNTNQMDDKVLVKTNGIPTYHLANICDDHDMGTTHTIRGEEWLSSTPLHVLIYKAFGWDMPEFAHLPLVLNPAPLKGKLSKRNAVKLGFPIFPFGGQSDEGYLKGFVDEGYDPAAVINFLLLLGWTPHGMQDGGEILSLEDGIKMFDLHSVHKAGARYDIDKLKFFNGFYLQNKTSNEELMKHVDFRNSNFTDAQKLEILDMAKKRSHFKHEMQHVVDIFVDAVKLDDKQSASITDLQRKTFMQFINLSENIDWNHDTIKQTINDACNLTGLKMGKFMPSVRTVLAGGITGPDMVSFMTIIGRNEVKNRIHNLNYALQP